MALRSAACSAFLVLTASASTVVAAPRTQPAPATQTRTPSASTDYAFQPGVRCPYCAGTAEHPDGRYGLHWHDPWRHVGLPEYIVTPVLFATAGAFGLGVVPEAKRAAWVGPILFDTPVREALEARSRSGRKLANALSNVLLFGSLAQPIVLDNLLVTLALRQAPDVAWQMFVINSEAYALALSLNAVTQRLAARERPYGQRCVNDGGEFPCDSPDRFRSFYSGHSATTATAAGLVCAHHTQLDLYADPYADSAACAGSVALALTTGMLRIAAEKHWASDVITGGLVGFASGYALPVLVYYRQFGTRAERHTPGSEPRVAVVPTATVDSVKLVAVGVF
ncbi:MAG: phosphatase PAP2 family protein [Polyangiaceae bacterium]|nr:phosphatase PAP2 family protein [Polyangiaceae bacterium]